MNADPSYVPAAGRAAFNRLYDPAIALTVRERTFRSRLRRQVLDATAGSATVVDVGCGTGTFATDLAQSADALTVIGVDGDPTILRRAMAKPHADKVEWLAAMADDLPVADESADAVVMSLLLHHLPPDAKTRALEEARRVLRPDGTLHVADWGRAHGPVMRGAFFLLQCLDGFANTRDHAAGRLPRYIAQAGFERLTTTARLRTVWGTLELWSARRSGS